MESRKCSMQIYKKDRLCENYLKLNIVEKWKMHYPNG